MIRKFVYIASFLLLLSGLAGPEAYAQGFSFIKRSALPKVVNATAVAMSGSATQQITIPATTAGNTLVVQIVSGNVNVTGVSDNAASGGNSYTLANSGATGNSRLYMYYAKNIKAGATIVTVTQSSGIMMEAWVTEVSGLDPNTPLLGASYSELEDASATPTAVTAATGAMCGMTFSFARAGASISGLAAGSKYTSLGTLNGNAAAYYAYSWPGAYEASWTQSPSADYHTMAASFRGAHCGFSGGNSGGPPSLVLEAEIGWENATNRTTGSFDVKAGDVLIAYVVTAHDYGAPGISGGSLTWTQRADSESSDYTDIRVWSAVANSDKTMSVTFTNSVGAIQFGGAVLVFRNSSGVGAAPTPARSSSGPPSLNITTTQANSAIVVISGDWTASSGSSRAWRTNAGPIMETTYFYSPGGYTAYAGVHLNAGPAGPYAVGLTTPNTQKFAIAAIEVKGP